MRRWAMGSVAVTALLAGWLWALQPQEVTLRFQFRPKETLVYEVTMRGEGTMTINVAGQEFTSQTQLDGTITETCQVERVGDYGIATILITERGKKTYQITLPNGEEKRDTEEVPPSRFRIRVEPSGRILQIQSLDKPKSDKEQPPSPLSDFNLQLTDLHEWGFKNLLLPAKPVRAGDSWDIAQSVEMTVEGRPVKLEIKGQGRFVGWDKEGERSCVLLETTTEVLNFGDMVQLQVVSKMTTEWPNLSDIFQLQVDTSNVAVDGTVKSHAKYWFDPDAGRLLRWDETLTFSVKFAVTLPTGDSMTFQALLMMNYQERLTKVRTTAPPGKS